MKMNKKHGFTLVEMLIIAPIVILVIGVFISAIVSMTGNVLVVRKTNTLAYNIQNALDLINQDVQSSGGFLATNNFSLTSPQGYNDNAVAFDNANSPAIGSILILNTYSTTSNPLSSTRDFVYVTGLPNACNSPLISQNTKVMMNIVYFVKNSTLWRRVVAPSNYATAGCSPPWQQPSCVPGYNPATFPFCKTQDTRLVDGVAAGGFTVNYFESGSTTANTVAGDSAQTDGARQIALRTTNTVNVKIDATSTTAGRNVTQSGTIRATSPNLAVTSTAPLNPVADWIAIAQGDHYGNFYDSVSSSYATATRAGAKTIYDPATQEIYDVPTNYLGVNPRSDGKGGNEAVIEEARTNYVLQSSFENTMSGWNYQYVANGSGAPSTDKSVYGSYSLKITRTVAVTEANVYYSLSGLTPSTTYSYSVYAWASQPNAACIFTVLATTDTPRICHSGNSTWQRLTGTFVSSATGTVQLRLGDIGPGPLTSSYYDAVQVEKGAFATSYIPTTTTAVTRNADVVTVPTTGWNGNAGTVFAVAGTSSMASSHSTSGNAWGWMGTNGYLTGLTYWDSYYIICGTNANYDYTSVSNGYHTRAGRWSAGNILRSVVDSVFGSQTYTCTVPAGLFATANIGSLNNSAFWDGSISRIIVYSSALSDSDINTVTNAVKDGP